MHTGAITSYIDVAQLTLYGFWAFFAGLILYLRREDKREGYPLVSERSATIPVVGFPPLPSAKTFILPHGGTAEAPRTEAAASLGGRATPAATWPGAPLQPTGNPMREGIGPAAFAHRAETPDLSAEEGMPKIVPLRIATEFSLAEEDPDPRGMSVLGADGKVAGTVCDVWIDWADMLVRYLEVEIGAGSASGMGAKRVILPINFTRISADARQVRVHTILAEQFGDVPALRNPDQITLREEDRITAYYGGGQMYATPARLGPLL